MEHHRSGVFLTEEDDVRAYQTAEAEVRALAVNPQESDDFIAKLV
ncbi:Scr1 family TA system antitoxin-like transcriptional regulator [Goodfellowiella coeruleoviolacea]